MQVLSSAVVIYVHINLFDCFVFLTPTTPDEVKTEINILSESTASDVPVKIIKIAFHPSGDMLSHIYNNSFGTGEYPTKLKFSIVTLIHKADSKLQVTNYRPISLLPVFSKISERLVHRRLLNFLMQNNIIFNHQFGFQPSKTTNMAYMHQNSQRIRKQRHSLLSLP